MSLLDGVVIPNSLRRFFDSRNLRAGKASTRVWNGNTADTGVVTLQIGIFRFFRIGEITALRNERPQTLFHSVPCVVLLIVRVVVLELHALGGIFCKTAVPIQKCVAVTEPAVFFFQESCGAFGIWLMLIKRIYTQLAALCAAAIP